MASNKEFEKELYWQGLLLQAKIEAEQTEFQRKITAESEACFNDLVRKHEHMEYEIKQKHAIEEKEMKLEREKELERIKAERKERMRMIEAEKQQEEERMEDEKRKFEIEIAQRKSRKMEEFHTLSMWKKREVEEKLQSTEQKINDDKLARQEEIASSKALQEEEIIVSAEWKKFVADRTSSIITSTTEMKAGAIGRIEQKRIDTLATSDIQRTQLYVKMRMMKDSFDEKEISSLDSIMLEPSLYQSQGAGAIASIEGQASKLSLVAPTTEEGTRKDLTTSELSHKRTTSRSIADELKHRKHKVDEKCKSIAQVTAARIESIEKPEHERLKCVGTADRKAIKLMDTIVSRSSGTFDPGFIASVNKELSPHSGAFKTQATEDIANIELKPD